MNFFNFFKNILFNPPKTIFIDQFIMNSYNLKDGDFLFFNSTNSTLFYYIQPHTFAGNLEKSIYLDDGSIYLKKLNPKESSFIKNKNISFSYKGFGGINIFIWNIPINLCENYNIYSVYHRSSEILIQNVSNISNICWFQLFNSKVKININYKSENSTLKIFESKEFLLFNNSNFISSINLVILNNISIKTFLNIKMESNISYSDWTDNISFFKFNLNSNTFLTTNRKVDDKIWFSFIGMFLFVFLITIFIMFIIPLFNYEEI